MDSCKKLRITHVRDRNLIEGRIYPKAEFDRIPNVPKFRSVDWTHDMIIVKWRLFIWHERKLCALTNRPPVQSTRTGPWLSTLFHANCSAAQVYVLHAPLAIHDRSKLQATMSFAVISFLWALKRIFWKIFVYVMMSNVMVRACLNLEIIKISKLIKVKN